MRVLLLLAAALALVAAPLVAAPVPKPLPQSTADKVRGSWKLTKADSELDPETAVVVEFSKDDKLTLTINVGGTKRISRNGTYKAEGDKITYTIESGAGERTEVLTIKKLTADFMHTVDPEGKNEEFNRVPMKK